MLNLTFIRILSICLVATLFGATSVCMADEKPVALEKVSLQLKWFHQFQFAGYYAAVEKGFYADEGLEVEIRERVISESFVKSVTSRKADFGVGDSGLVSLYAKGEPIKALAAIFQHNPLIFMARQDSGIISPYEMVGKRIMSDIISSNEAPLRAMLLGAKIGDKDYTLIPQKNEYNLLLSKEIDVISGYLTDQPYYFKEVGLPINIINPMNYGIDFYAEILFTSKKFLQENPDKVERFLRASLKGWRYALDNPEELVQIIHNKYHSNLSIGHLRFEAAEIRKLIVPEAVEIGHIDFRRLKPVADAYASSGRNRPLTDADLSSFVYQSQRDNLKLAPEEKAWLSRNPVINVGIDNDFAPYEKIDDKGDYVGMVADYMRLIEISLGVRFKIDPNKSWSETLAMAKNGKVDMIAAAVQTPKRSEFLYFTPPYRAANAVIIDGGQGDFIGDLNNLSGKRVVVEKGYFLEELIAKDYPKIKLRTAKGTLEALQMVLEGHADAYVGDANRANYVIKKVGLAALRFSGQTNYVSEHRIAVSKGQPLLFSIMRKAMDSIPKANSDAIFNRSIDLQIEPGIRYKTLYLYIVLALLVWALILLWITRLRREIKNRKNAENALSKSQQMLNEAQQIAQIGSCEWILHDNSINCSSQAKAIYGLGIEAASFDDLQRRIYHEDYYRVMAAIELSINQDVPFDLEYRLSGESNSLKYVHAKGKVFKDLQGKANRMTITAMDVTERKLSEKVLRILAEGSGNKDKSIFELIVEELALAHSMRYAFIACVDDNNKSLANTLAIFADSHFLPNFSYNYSGTPSHLVTQLGQCFCPENLQSLFPDDPLLVDMEAESYLGFALKNSMGEVIGSISVVDDKPMPANLKIRLEPLMTSLATRVAIEIERQKSDKKLRLSANVFKSAHEGIIITDKDGIIVDVNPTFTSITGYAPEEVIGKKTNMLSSGKHSRRFFAEMWEALKRENYWRGELWNRKKNGEIFEEFLTISVLFDENGEVANYVGLFSDITHSKEQQRSLELMAHYDPLTGLPNRTLFSDRFQHAVAHSQRNRSRIAVCFLDVDGFKGVNDSYGHVIGDQLLIEVSRRISASIREEDTVSRMGGDEFAMLIGEVDSYEACNSILARMLNAIAAPYELESHTIKVTASCGVTLYPDDKEELDTLLRHADQAMYRAKLMGKNKHQLFDPKLDQQVAEKNTRLQNLKQAFENREFALYYQPKVNMKTGVVFGAEALIRWLHPEKGLIPPFEFLPFLDGTELEIEVGNWVINEALDQLVEWQAMGIDFEVSVNISSHHLQSPKFYDQLEDSLKRHPNIEPKCLQLEILESSALGDLNRISKIVQSCYKLGVQIALDDFGTGYSSLAHLRSLVAQTVKIDSSFIFDFLDDPSDFAIVEGVIGLSQAFNRDIIAEGIESTEHGIMLLMMGCQHGQGYVIARPMPAQEIPVWLQAYVPNLIWLDYAEFPRNPRERKLQQLKLIYSRWFKRIESNIHANPNDKGNWPTIDLADSHHGVWLKHKKHEELFEPAFIDELERIHHRMHQFANSLFEEYSRGEHEKTQFSLAELEAEYKKIMVALN